MNEAHTKGGPVDRSAQKRDDRPKPTAVKIKIEDFAPPVAEKPKRRYWVGTSEDCPFQNVTVAGTTFPRFSGLLHFDADGKPTTRPEPGALIPLDADHVERIKTEVAQKVFRTTGDRAILLTRRGQKDKPYVPIAADKPVGRFLYMHDVTDGFPPSYHGGTPETMID